MPFSNDAYTIYDDFMKLFPLEKIQKMTLDEYTNLEKTSFCYWIENKLDAWGNIRGATSYKFGIYRWNKKPELIKQGNLADDKYAWQDRFGKTAQEAFDSIKSKIVKIVISAQKEDYASIDAIDISEMFKWKIAFLYSDGKLIDWYSREALLLFAKNFGMMVNDKTPTSELQKILINVKGDKSLKQFDDELLPIWHEYQEEKPLKDEGIHRKYWIVKVSEDNYWDKTISNNIWYSQQRYGYQEASTVTNFLKQVKNINKNDVLLLASGNGIYAYGFTQDSNLVTNQISSIDEVISTKSYKYKSGIVKFKDNEVFYENLENGEEDWAERINVEKWLCYNSKSKVNTSGVKESVTSGITSMSIYGVSKEYGEKKMTELENQANENQSLVEKIEKILRNSHNIILHGAPGTGKTYLARDIAKVMNAEVGFVQFHPSYDYTDFVEGLRPMNTGNSGQIGFDRKDGVFKKFCETALKNLKDSQKTTEQISKEISIDEKMEDFLSSAIDENIELKIVTGNKFFVTDFNEKNIYISIPENEKVNELVLQRLELSSLLNSEDKIENGTAVKEFFKRKWRTQQDSYVLALYKEIKKMSSSVKISDVKRIEKKNFVFIIDEINRGEMSKIFGELFFSIDPGYRGKDGLIQTQYQNLVPEGDTFSEGFFIPENVYIIGTMNDIDRNVESMDFAFRRRFTFMEITAKDTQQQILAGFDDSIRDEVINRMDSLNDAISNIEGLSSAYHIGGAYFLKLKELDNDFELLWEYHLEGLLREYLRGMEDSESKLEDLKKAYNQEA